MLRGVGQGQAGELGQALDRTLALGCMFQQFQAVALTQDAGQLGELFEYFSFRTRHSINNLIDCMNRVKSRTPVEVTLMTGRPAADAE
jgi:hypothetical protein